jgi:O-antigen ligase
MATTEATGTAIRGLDRVVRPPGRKALFAGLMLVLLFSVLTVWTHDRWAISSTQVAVFLLALVAAFRSTILGSGWPKNWLQFPLFATVIWGLVQLETNRSVYRYETWSAVLDWITVAFAFVIGVQVFENESLIRGFRLLAIYFGALLALVAILQLFSAEGKVFWIYSPVQGTPMGPFANRDHYSAYIELLLPFALWEALVDRRRAILFGCLAAIMYASVIAGASRAGSVLVNLELGAVLIPALTRGGRIGSRGAGRVILRIALLVLIFSAIVGWDVLLKRFEERDPFAGRREAWISGVAMIRDRPWMGCGLGTWTTAYPAYAIIDIGAFLNAAHSDWVQWAGEGGIPFAVLMLIVAARALQLGIRAPWGLGVTFVFLHCLVDFPLQKPPIFLWVIVVLAALEAGRPKIRSSSL